MCVCARVCFVCHKEKQKKEREVASPSDCVAALREDFLKLKVGGFSSPSVGRRHSEKKIFLKKNRISSTSAALGEEFF
jgi:hypothetical protein